MKQWIIITFVVAICTLGGCSGKLAYTPEPGSPAVPVSAQHHQANGRMYVYVNSEGFPVESAVLVRSDGHLVQPEAIHRPAELAAGVAERDRHATAQSSRSLAQTIVIFPFDGVGPAPWRFRIKIENYPDVSIELPAITGN